MLKPIIPKRDRGELSDPVSVRFPKDVLKRIDRAAAETRNKRSEAILHLVEWALEKYEAQREAEEKGEESASAG